MNNEKLDMILDQIENMSHLKSEDIPSLDFVYGSDYDFI